MVHVVEAVVYTPPFDPDEYDEPGKPEMSMLVSGIDIHKPTYEYTSKGTWNIREYGDTFVDFEAVSGGERDLDAFNRSLTLDWAYFPVRVTPYRDPMPPRAITKLLYAPVVFVRAVLKDHRSFLGASPQWTARINPDLADKARVVFELVQV